MRPGPESDCPALLRRVQGLQTAEVCGKKVRLAESQAKTTLFVGNLLPETDSEGLRGLFAEFGELVRCFVVSKEGDSWGYGFVEFALPAQA